MALQHAQSYPEDESRLPSGTTPLPTPEKSNTDTQNRSVGHSTFDRSSTQLQRGGTATIRLGSDSPPISVPVQPPSGRSTYLRQRLEEQRLYAALKKEEGSDPIQDIERVAERLFGDPIGQELLAEILDDGGLDYGW